MIFMATTPSPAAAVRFTASATSGGLWKLKEVSTTS